MRPPAAGSPGGLRNAIVGSIMHVRRWRWSSRSSSASSPAPGWPNTPATAATATSCASSTTCCSRRRRSWSACSSTSILVAPFHGFSAIAGAVALALIAVPVITRTTEDVLRLQPTPCANPASRWARRSGPPSARSSGAPARSGILTGALLAFARISGETAPLLFTALSNQFFSNWDLTKPIASLPVVIFNFALAPYDDLHACAWAGAADRRGHRARHQHHRRASSPPGSIAAHDRHPDPPSYEQLRRRACRRQRSSSRRANLNFFYGKTQALHGVSMPVRRTRRSPP